MCVCVCVCVRVNQTGGSAAQDLDGTVYEGGQWTLEVDAPLSKLPCFVRLGALGVLKGGL